MVSSNQFHLHQNKKKSLNNYRIWNWTREKTGRPFRCTLADKEQCLDIFLGLWAYIIHNMLHNFCSDCKQGNVCSIHNSVEQLKATDNLGFLSHAIGALPLSRPRSISLHSSDKFCLGHQWCVFIQSPNNLVMDKKEWPWWVWKDWKLRPRHWIPEFFTPWPTIA